MVLTLEEFGLLTIWPENVHDSSIAFHWECFVPREILINPLKMKRKLLHLKAQFMLRSKHFSSQL